MPNLSQLLALSTTVRTALERIHPIAPWAALTVAIFAAVYISRKAFPKLWILFDAITPDGMISHFVQGLPSVLAGSLLSALLTGGEPGALWKGALSGAAAPVLHLLLKKLPGPYQGAVRGVLANAGILAILASIWLVAKVAIIALYLSACAAFQRDAKSVHDEISKLCDVVGEQQHDAIAARAQTVGLSFADVYQAWHRTCEANALLGTTRSVGAIGSVGQ